MPGRDAYLDGLLVKHGYADHRAGLKQDVRLVVNNDPR